MNLHIAESSFSTLAYNAENIVTFLIYYQVWKVIYDVCVYILNIVYIEHENACAKLSVYGVSVWDEKQRKKTSALVHSFVVGLLTIHLFQDEVTIIPIRILLFSLILKIFTCFLCDIYAARIMDTNPERAKRLVEIVRK